MWLQNGRLQSVLVFLRVKLRDNIYFLQLEMCGCDGWRKIKKKSKWQNERRRKETGERKEGGGKLGIVEELWLNDSKVEERDVKDEEEEEEIETDGGWRVKRSRPDSNTRHRQVCGDWNVHFKPNRDVFLTLINMKLSKSTQNSSETNRQVDTFLWFCKNIRSCVPSATRRSSDTTWD